MSTPLEQRNFEAAIVGFPIQANVRGNEALAKALGPTRQRDMSVVGTVIEYDRDRLRIGVNWIDRHIEYLAPKYLERVGG